MSEEASISASVADGIASIDKTLSKGIASMTRVLNAVNTKLDAVCGAVLDGDDKTYPWDRLGKAKRRQVLAVREHMTDNPRDTLWRSCVATFVPAPGGYPSAKALSAYCYQIQLGIYAGRRAK